MNITPVKKYKNPNYPTSLYSDPQNPNEKAIKSTHKGNLKLEGYDKDKKISFEFISVDDYKEWQKKQGFYSTVETYDCLSAAKVLRDGINGNQGDSSVGVFYNPMISPQSGGRLKETETMLAAKDELKKQVKDFFEWLKAQGCGRRRILYWTCG